MKKIRLILIILLALIFVVSATWSVCLLLRNRKEAAFYETVQQEYVQIIPVQIEKEPETAVTQPEQAAPQASAAEEEQEPPVQEEAVQIQVDFEALLQAGSDVKGWIYVPGTNISYPIVQGADNKYYERRDHTGTYAWAGSIFMDYRSTADFSGRNTVLYGHNIQNGTMFSQLKKFRDSAFAAENSSIFVATPEAQLEYEIVSVLIADALGPVYTFSFADDAAYEQYLQTVNASAVWNSGAELTADDQLLLLSTCTNRQRTERLLVVGRLLPEKPLGD